MIRSYADRSAVVHRCFSGRLSWACAGFIGSEARLSAAARASWEEVIARLVDDVVAAIGQTVLACGSGVLGFTVAKRPVLLGHLGEDDQDILGPDISLGTEPI